MSKKGQYYPANILKANGFETPFATKDPNSPNLNPVGFYSPNRDKYIDLWSNYDMNQYCSMLKWSGLPKNLTSEMLNRMLYYRGSLACFKTAGIVYILPYAERGSLNSYGVLSEIEPIPFNGKLEDPTAKGVFGKYTVQYSDNVDEIESDENTAILLFDSVPAYNGVRPISRGYLNKIIIVEIADALARVNINMVVSNAKILLIAKDAKQADAIKLELATAFNSDSPFAVLTSELETQTVQSTNDFNCDEIFNVVKNWDAIRCFMSGISASQFGADSKDRLTTGDLNGAAEQKDLIADQRLDLAQKFCAKVNKAFGINISVELRTKDYDDYTNGNGDTEADLVDKKMEEE